jgi:hypothetical protein
MPGLLKGCDSRGVFESLDSPRARRPLTNGTRALVVAAAIVAAPVVYLGVSLSVAVSFEVLYPVSGFITCAVVSVAAIVAVILLERRVPGDWYLRATAWGLLLIILASCYSGFVVGQAVSGLDSL